MKIHFSETASLFPTPFIYLQDKDNYFFSNIFYIPARPIIIKNNLKLIKLHMMKKLLLGLILIFSISCNKDGDNLSFKEENGNVWLSGGLLYCAEQIRLDNGDTLTFHLTDIIMSLKAGDRVRVKYKEIGINEFCPPYIDCKIIKIEKIK